MIQHIVSKVDAYNVYMVVSYEMRDERDKYRNLPE